MSEAPVTTKFTVTLDAATNERFDQLVQSLARATGPLPSHRGRRRPGRADLLRAALVVLENDRGAMAAVRNQVLREALAPPAASEVQLLAAEVQRGAAWLSTPDAQDAASVVVDELNQLSASINDDEGAAADELHRQSLRLARLAATAGGYEGLRPLLDIARRLELVRDAIDPTEMLACLYCNQDVRLGDDGVRFEQHAAQAGDMCPGGGS